MNLKNTESTASTLLLTEISSQNEDKIQQRKFYNCTQSRNRKLSDKILISAKFKINLKERTKIARSLSRETPKFPHPKGKVKLSPSLLVKKKVWRPTPIKLNFPKNVNSNIKGHSRNTRVNTSFEKFITHDHVSALKEINESLNSYTDCPTLENRATGRFTSPILC
ncbi:unnamed protein product [Moneuplotes crassus]|uniref:Uncharacterized protein n=1 Tax=Euplotes crassus TaxID=5936 RepID=A0AAD1U7A5_EUPCR|nr:unnamed protein product [Moneuplotes crassus]